MAQLVTLRQRIKAIETVKKTTNAMRLISMSIHSRIRQRQEALGHYQNALNKLMGIAKQKSQSAATQHLHIVIGSQKGLCGNFNTSMSKFFLLHKPKEPYTLIVVGKQLHSLLTHEQCVINSFFDQLSINNYSEIAENLAQLILTQYYSQVTLYYKEQKSFFLQRPLARKILPLPPLIEEQEPSEPVIFDDRSPEFYHHIVYTYLYAQLSAGLISSLLAEQASRFISMDTATRNAETMLNTMKLDYNKLRQALITRELTDLSGSNLKPL